MIFYFSATGNSRYVAERIAAATGDEALSIAEWLEGCDCGAVERETSVGIVSPTYAWGLPIVVRDFLRKLDLRPEPSYLWFVATYGTTPGQTGRFADDILREKGLNLSARFSVKMPDTWTPLFDLSDAGKVRRINEAAERCIDEAAARIRSRDRGDFMERKTPLLLSKAVHALEYDSMRRTSRFKVEDSCVGCGLCARNCPISVIEIREKKPAWTADRCAMCLACLHRCPKFAIQYGNRTKSHGQYTHAEFAPGQTTNRSPKS